MRHLTTVVAALVLAVTAWVAGCGSPEATASGDKDRDPKPGDDSGLVPTTNDPNTTDENAIVTTATGVPCDVDAILRARCQTCHSAEPKYGANTALVTYADLQKDYNGKKVLDLVRARVANDGAPMPPSPQPRLTEAERKTIDDWANAGAKASDAQCTGKAAGDGVKALSCKPDQTLVATKDFVMQPNTPLDQYACFGVDINVSKKRHITALAPKVDNPKIVHHILLFKTPTPVATDPFPCEAFGSASWELVAGWAPGGDNLELPKEAGFPEDVGTTHFVIQMHYNNATAKTGNDRSGYELCTTEELRPNDAAVVAFGSIAFAIPPRSEHKIRCDYLNPIGGDKKLFNASPHMHTAGVSMSTERIPNGGTGTPELIFEQKAFSFEAQANFPITKSINGGDLIRTRCGWKNPGDKTIGFGEGTGDEMCFNFIGYYPAVKVPGFTWVTPPTASLCTPE